MNQVVKNVNNFQENPLHGNISLREKNNKKKNFSNQSFRDSTKRRQNPIAFL